MGSFIISGYQTKSGLFSGFLSFNDGQKKGAQLSRNRRPQTTLNKHRHTADSENIHSQCWWASNNEKIQRKKTTENNRGWDGTGLAEGIWFPFLSLFGAGPLKNVIRALTLIAIVVLCCQTASGDIWLISKSFTLVVIYLDRVELELIGQIRGLPPTATQFA